MADLLHDPRTVELLRLLWSLPNRESGAVIADLSPSLRDDGMFTEWIGTKLIEVTRQNHCHVGGGEHRRLVIENGWSVADFDKPNRKRIWQFLQEAISENVVDERIRHRVRLTPHGELVAAGLARESEISKYPCPKCGGPLPAIDVTIDERGEPELRWCPTCRSNAEQAVVWWPMYPFRSTTFTTGTFSAEALRRLPASIPIPSRPATDAEIALFCQSLPGVDHKKPNWEMVRGILLAHGINVDADTSVDAFLGILHAMSSKQRTSEPEDISQKTTAGMPDSADVRDLCHLLNKNREHLASGRKTAIGIAREFTKEKPGNDRKAHSLMRQARRFPHLWKDADR